MPSLNSDIEKYLKGELTPAEMHELEKKALRDPFLAEALEGAEQAGIDNFTLDLNIIRKSIRKKSKHRKPKIISLNGWQLYSGIAAGLLLLAVSSYIVISLIKQQDKSEQLAQTESTTSAPEPTMADSLTAQLGDATTESATHDENLTLGLVDTVILADQERMPVQPYAYSTSDNQDSRLATRTSDETVPNLREQIAGLHIDDVINAKPDSIAVPSELIEPADDVQKTSALARAGFTESVVAKGKVTHALDGSPLPGVNVVIKGTNVGTVTDLEGNYELKADPGQELTFAFIGFSSQDIPVTHTDHLQHVTLTEDVTQLSEVVVTGYGGDRVEREEKPTTFEMAEPSGGRRAFKKYLEEHLHYPQPAIQNKIEGRVTVQFTVEPNGALSNFKVVKGIGHGCDDEVIRLIKQGPAWSPTRKGDKPVTDRVRVRLRFNLPED